MNKDLELSADVNGFVDKLLELSPKYQAIKIYDDEIKNNPNLSPIEKMAFTLERRKILKQVENLASTFNLADLLLKDKGKSLENEISNINDEWFGIYNDIVKNISDEEMQTIWAKILETECEKQGSISKKLLSILQVMDKKTAETFSIVCKHTIVFEKPDKFKSLQFILPRIQIKKYNNYILDKFINKLGINNIQIEELVDLGLIVSAYNKEFAVCCKYAIIHYFDEKLLINSNPKNNIMPLSYYQYSRYGKELANILYKDMEKDILYMDFLLEYLKSLGNNDVHKI